MTAYNISAINKTSTDKLRIKVIKDVIQENTATISSIIFNSEFVERYDFLLKEFLPRISLGRQVGHTSAARQFISENSNLSIGIMTRDLCTYNISYAGFKNARYISKATIKDASRHHFDYLIIDDLVYDSPIVVGMFRELTTTYRNTFLIKPVRVISIGN